jgi:beta-glucosidase/6-phospho-beta-glucosidase/beta-galactosidase
MSEDIRKMIDKVKNFKQFVNEQYENYIQWKDLPLSVKNDITENLRDNIEYLQQNYWNSEALRDMIDDVIKQPKFKIEYKNVNDLYNELTQIGWGISEKNVKELINVLNNGKELEPIILNNGKFFDGGHRLTAYKRLRKEMIPTIDIGFMLNFDWEKWDNDDVNF